MKTFGLSALAISALAVFAVLTPVSKADDWNKTTTTTFANPIEIPGQVLPAGTYTFKMLDSAFAQNVVQILNADQTRVVATVHTIRDHMDKPYDNAVFNADHQGSMDRLDSWFYPGDENGFQFDYSQSPSLQ